MDGVWGPRGDMGSPGGCLCLRASGSPRPPLCPRSHDDRVLLPVVTGSSACACVCARAVALSICASHWAPQGVTRGDTDPLVSGAAVDSGCRCPNPGLSRPSRAHVGRSLFSIPGCWKLRQGVTSLRRSLFLRTSERTQRRFGRGLCNLPPVCLGIIIIITACVFMKKPKHVGFPPVCSGVSAVGARSWSHGRRVSDSRGWGRARALREDRAGPCRVFRVFPAEPQGPGRREDLSTGPPAPGAGRLKGDARFSAFPFPGLAPGDPLGAGALRGEAPAEETL